MRAGVWVFATRLFAAVVLALVVLFVLVTASGSVSVALLVILFMIGLGFATARTANRTMSGFIAGQLRKSGEFSIHASGVWNPSRGPSARLAGNAHARYWLDDSGLVHLDYRPKHGPPQHFVGPLPEG